ncbi:Nramp family divalent metal transporter [Galbibacter sp. EGI 63066]|uniref:Nramp family divalent metal transporter n=1 Tax=Galbibacter sp. EGI 63066 TaxID=2993559 RepID=UPI0022497A5F|nr:Nramp family divalent metal transporter [Galbibacter sp. EGI 63066]MCX2681165.1 Nramp family divalent metal transporter [Galbibacter sp. EGI 63066]
MKNFLKKLGPGLLFAGAAIGVSHLVQSTRAGADYGYGLLWALFLVHLFKYPFFQFAPRYAMATGESLLDGYKKLGKGVLYAYFVLNFATMFTIQTAVTIVTAGLASNLFGITSSATTWSIIITIICMAVLMIGKYKFLDNLMKIIITTLTICTVIAIFIAVPNTTENVHFGQVLPTDTVGLAFLIAFMGWMPAPLDISVWQSLWAIEKRKVQKSYKTKSAVNDFNVGYLSTILLGVFFLSLGALVMYHSEESFDSGATQFASQFINMYTETLGDYTYYIIAIAAFTAMFSTTLTTLDASPRAMAKASHLLFNIKSKYSFAVWIVILATGTVCILLFYLSEMKLLIDIATILSFVTAPFYAIINYKLVCSSHMPKKWRPSVKMHILSWAGIVFLVGFSIWYLISI